MSKIKRITEAQSDNMKKMRKIGMSVADIAEHYDVSTVTVYDHVQPGFYQKRLDALKTRYRRERPKTDDDSDSTSIFSCQLCGEKKHLFHRGDTNMWLCSDCCWIAKVADSTPDALELHMKYLEIRRTETKEVIESVSDSGNNGVSK